MKSNALARFLRELLGNSRSTGDSAAGAEMNVGSIRRVHAKGPNAKPMSTRIRFTDDGKPGAAIGVGGALLPEWDAHRDRYRPDWCRVIDFPLTVTADISAAAVPRDDVLRRRLSRIGLGPTVLRRRADGDELDIEALIDLFVDLRSGYSPPEHVYLEHRKLARDLGVLILVDASGSATDADPEGLAVHEHQRRAAATIAATLEELGDRVAVYRFRSHGRHSVQLPAIKTFGQRFGAVLAALRLHQLQPSGYTQLGGYSGGGRDPQGSGRYTEPAATAVVGRLPLRRGLRGHVRRSRRVQGARGTSVGRLVLPACAFQSARPATPTRSTEYSAPPDTPAPQLSPS